MEESLTLHSDDASIAALALSVLGSLSLNATNRVTAAVCVSLCAACVIK